MGDIKTHPPVKLVAAITFAPEIELSEIKRKLGEIFSPIDLEGPVYEFSFTNYYRSEMGPRLQKQMVSFRELIPVELLPDFKIATNQLEGYYARSGKRRVNIDPGYLTAAKLVLATTKDYDHRIYLSRGIFGDVHLRFRKGHFQINEWTYPDYRQPVVLQFFEQVREQYMQQLKDWKQI